MKKIASFLLAFCLLLEPTVFVKAEKEQESQMAEETAGDMRMSMTLDAYFSMRNDTFSGEAAVMAQCESTLAAVSANNELTAKNLQRLAAPKDMAEYHDTHIVDTSVSYQIESVTETEPSIYEVEVYEWTWVYYNDGRGGPVDKMGFGTNHAMVLRELDDGGYIIVEDDYDDSDIMGPHDHTKVPVSEKMEVNGKTNAMPDNTNSTYRIYVLNIPALIEYANRWVSHLNDEDYNNKEYNLSEYKDFGKDCTNYVSQCLEAGGMKYDFTPGGGWWYKRSTGNDRSLDSCSSSWSGAKDFYIYWNAKANLLRGNDQDKRIDAIETTVIPGDPIVCADDDWFYHVAICVGYNSQNKLVFNAHTNDRYQVQLSYYQSSSLFKYIYVVQLAERDHAYVCNGDNIFLHTYKCARCGVSYTEKHEWVKKNDYYVCSICSMTSSFIPIQPVGNLLGTPLTQETAEK